MTVIAHDEVEQIVQIIDDILKSGYSHPVSYFKEKYHLTNDEYTMIFDLTMPFIRRRNDEKFWSNQYASLRHSIFNALQNDTSETTLRIRRILKEEYEETSSKLMKDNEDYLISDGTKLKELLEDNDEE